MVESMLKSIKIAVVCGKDMMEKDFGGMSGCNYIDFWETEPEDFNRYHAVFSCKVEEEKEGSRFCQRIYLNDIKV